MIEQDGFMVVTVPEDDPFNGIDELSSAMMDFRTTNISMLTNRTLIYNPETDIDASEPEQEVEVRISAKRKVSNCKHVRPSNRVFSDLRHAVQRNSSPNVVTKSIRFGSFSDIIQVFLVRLILSSAHSEVQ